MEPKTHTYANSFSIRQILFIFLFCTIAKMKYISILRFCKLVLIDYKWNELQIKRLIERRKPNKNTLQIKHTEKQGESKCRIYYHFLFIYGWWFNTNFHWTDQKKNNRNNMSWYNMLWKNINAARNFKWFDNGKKFGIIKTTGILSIHKLK